MHKHSLNYACRAVIFNHSRSSQRAQARVPSVPGSRDPGSTKKNFSAFWRLSRNMYMHTPHPEPWSTHLPPWGPASLSTPRWPKCTCRPLPLPLWCPKPPEHLRRVTQDQGQDRSHPRCTEHPRGGLAWEGSTGRCAKAPPPRRLARNSERTPAQST